MGVETNQFVNLLGNTFIRLLVQRAPAERFESDGLQHARSATGDGGRGLRRALDEEIDGTHAWIEGTRQLCLKARQVSTYQAIRSDKK